MPERPVKNGRRSSQPGRGGLTTVPLALVASDYIYQTIIRHGYDGIDGAEFLPLVTVNVGDRRRRGWVQLPPASGIPVAVPALSPAYAF